MSGAILHISRQTSAPKCANCGWWAGRDGTGAAAMCEQHGIKTLDLAVCTGWREHEVLTGQIVTDEPETFMAWRDRLLSEGKD